MRTGRQTAGTQTDRRRPLGWLLCGLCVLFAGCADGSGSNDGQIVSETGRGTTTETVSTPHRHPHEVTLRTADGRAYLEEEPGQGIFLSLDRPEFSEEEIPTVEFRLERGVAPLVVELDRLGPRAFLLPTDRYPEGMTDIEDLSGEVVIRAGEMRYRGEIEHHHVRANAIPQPEPNTVQIVTLLVVYCGAILFASLLGGYLPSRVRLTHRRMQFLVSMIAGLMLGIAIFHLLPHAVVELSSRENAATGPHGGELLTVEGTAYAVEVFRRPSSRVLMLYPLRLQGDAVSELDVNRLAVTWAGGIERDAESIEAGRVYQVTIPIGLLPNDASPIPSGVTLRRGEQDYSAERPDPAMRAIDLTVLCVMAGLLVMFFLIRAFHFHHHGDITLPGDPDAEISLGEVSSAEDSHALGSGHSHDHDHDHDSHHAHTGHDHGSHSHSHGTGRPPSWVGIFIGLAAHTLLDGMALAASVRGDAVHAVSGPGGWLLGLGTFLAILLHKPLDAVSITTLMTASGRSARSRSLVNLGFACMCPLGAGLFLLGLSGFSDSRALITGCCLAISAGVFLCVSLGDLLPELELHSHDRLWLSLTLLLGIAVAYGIVFLEPAHTHAH